MECFINELGNNIILRNMTISDAKKMVSWTTHKDRLFANYDFPKFTNNELVQWFEKKNKSNRLIMSICDLNNDIIGYISLRNINKIFKTSEMGILLEPSKINLGYGSDAICTMVKWYFEKLGFKKLFLRVAMYNKRAYKVYRKIGFEPMYTLYEEFNNNEIDVLGDEQYLYIRKYFKVSFHKIYVKCIKMKLSTK